MAQTKAYSVSAVNSHIRILMAGDRALKNLTVAGEISNYKPHPSGHVYFTLKDAKSQMKTVMWSSSTYTGIHHRLADGQKVLVTGDVVCYDAGGYYQLQAVDIRLEGAGDLYEEFEKLKAKLDAEGLFEIDHKLPIPSFPRTIGIVTARQGDALRDIVSTLKRRNPYVQPILCPAKVQGDGAAQSVCKAIRVLESRQVDLILVCRGGGSIEDLWAFNGEMVARCVYDCRVPIISGVGHEPDRTIIDFVSDLRAPTPTGAAEMAVKPVADIEAELVDCHVALTSAMMSYMEKLRLHTEHTGKLLNAQSPRNRLERRREQVDQTGDRLHRDMRKLLEQLRMRTNPEEQAKRLRVNLQHCLTRYHLMVQNGAKQLEALSPLQKISKGYGYLTDAKGNALESVESISTGDSIDVYIRDGKLSATVNEIEQQTVFEE